MLFNLAAIRLGQGVVSRSIELKRTQIQAPRKILLLGVRLPYRCIKRTCLLFADKSFVSRCWSQPSWAYTFIFWHASHGVLNFLTKKIKYEFSFKLTRSFFWPNLESLAFHQRSISLNKLTPLDLVDQFLFSHYLLYDNVFFSQGENRKLHQK